MPDLPRGTVTFLFSDVEGSTRLLDELGDAYADALEGHRRVLREAFAAHDGVEVDTQGDAFFVAFARATEAAAAALDAQRALADARVRVRIGLHTGEPLLRAEGYVGMDVHHAARVMSAGHGGQIVVSERTHSFLRDDLPLVDLGVHRLKDLRQAERLFQLGSGKFPPLRTLDATNLPIAASELIGRKRELGEVVDLLGDSARVVTITGPGGTGKTRLALQVCAELVGVAKDGVFWVPLASLTEAELVIPEIAQALGAKDDLRGYLRDREVLLLLDNLEHLLDAAPALTELLRGAKGLRLLATSRAPLRISGEHEYVLEPLAPSESVALFCERARAVGRLVPADGTVEEICRRLDGLPLAIELAAARTKLISPETLLERLERTLPVLTGGPRDAPARQRTLQATIEWSHDLLDDESTVLFRRAAVFAGGFSLSAAEQVCDTRLDALGSLVDLSLLKTLGDDRFLMLETIREYALEQLERSGEADQLSRSHADYFTRVAEEAYAKRVEDEAAAARQLEVDHDNIRAAIDWLGANDRRGELELAGAVGWFLLTHGHHEEATRRLRHALESATEPTPAAARALAAAGSLSGQTGRQEDAGRYFTQSIAAWREIGDQAELVSTLETFGWALFFGGEERRSQAVFEEALELRRTLSGSTAPALAGVCQVLVAKGDVDRAELLSRELLQTAAERGDLRSEHFALHFLADAALMRAEHGEAIARYRASLRAALSLGDVVETSLEVQGVAMALAGSGDLSRAARLGGAVETLWESIGLVLEVRFWHALLDRYLGPLRADEAWNEGRALPFDDAVELALAEAS